MVRTFGQDRFEFILNETQTHQIIQDVKNRFSDLGILYIGMGNETRHSLKLWNSIQIKNYL